MFRKFAVITATAATVATANLFAAMPVEAHPHGRHWPGHNWHLGPMCHKVWVKRHHHWVRVTQCHPLHRY